MNFVMMKFDNGIVKKMILKIINYIFFIKVYPKYTQWGY